MTIIVNSAFFGHGDNELGARLMGSFLRKLSTEANKPKEIVFYNSGVKLLAEGSAVLDAMELLAAAGIDLIACGTCVSYFNLQDKIKAGRVGDMVTIISTLANSDKVITV